MSFGFAGVEPESSGSMKITLLDYGAGNVRSVVNALAALGQDVVMAVSPEDIRMARVWIPSVIGWG